jgi:hypothetical protein
MGRNTTFVSQCWRWTIEYTYCHYQVPYKAHVSRETIRYQSHLALHNEKKRIGFRLYLVINLTPGL